MEPIIDQLYTDFCCRDEICKKHREKLWAEYDPMAEKVKAAFGIEFLNRFTELDSYLEREDGMSNFRQGFRLGIRLMLEALTPA